MKLIATIVAALLLGSGRRRAGRGAVRKPGRQRGRCGWRRASSGVRGPGCRFARSIRTGDTIRSIRCPIAIEYPGPNAKRECAARYVQEYPPERHGDRAAHALLVGAGLGSIRVFLSGNSTKPDGV